MCMKQLIITPEVMVSVIADDCQKNGWEISSEEAESISTHRSGSYIGMMQNVFGL